MSGITGRIIMCEDIANPRAPSRCRVIDPLGTCDPECGRYVQPSGYNDAHRWADRMLVDHEQRQCAGCGLWKIWVPRTVDTERGGPT